MNQLLDNTGVLNKQVELLASIEPTGMNFLTCYLDTRGDRRQVQQAFRRLQMSYRHKLNAREKTDFEHAVKMVDVYLENLDSKVSSVAVFSRGILGGQFFLAIPLAEQRGSQLIFQNTPSISLLLELQESDSDISAAQDWLIYLQQNAAGAEGRKKAVLEHTIEKDDSSYSIADNRDVWPAGPPLALQQPARHPGSSLDLVA